ncbi:hypothetical protein LCGC14_1351080 [marine sediment metagenome]|uniref:Uncharacterized protein n=1 Tax=marine sediment metagenome TaxID=412755 RepID=A0A0F9MRN7_9ZZZZ
MKTKIAFWIAHHLPARVIFYVIPIVFVNASSGKWGGEFVEQVNYEKVFDRWIEKHNIKNL